MINVFLCGITIAGDEIPGWVLKGMLSVETSSYYDEDGNITYIDRRIGKAGERGPFQMTRIAFDEVSTLGEKFSDLGNNTKFAEEMAIRYLRWLYENHAGKSWKRAVAMYNTGPCGYYRKKSRGDRYACRVYAKGTETA
jgi:hypothetical protein